MRISTGMFTEFKQAVVDHAEHEENDEFPSVLDERDEDERRVYGRAVVQGRGDGVNPIATPDAMFTNPLEGRRRNAPPLPSRPTRSSASRTEAGVEFGFFLSSEEHGPNDLVAFAQAAESAGFRSALISDHYHPWLDEQGQSSFVWTVIGALAATTDLRVTTGVTCPTVRIHPAIVRRPPRRAQP